LALSTLSSIQDNIGKRDETLPQGVDPPSVIVDDGGLVEDTVEDEGAGA
jgi:hypothetical protein